ncbi:unnamed protein product [Linum trigynum]|uniref:Uncharacterized protein n=1 Tax=Linum trigynum TaxID=586398 RepID=A0AAV2DA59_9ROSI
MVQVAGESSLFSLHSSAAVSLYSTDWSPSPGARPSSGSSVFHFQLAAQPCSLLLSDRRFLLCLTFKLD